MTVRTLSNFVVCTLLTIFSTAVQSVESLPQNIPLSNAGFEVGLNNWSATALKDQVSSVTDGARSGTGAVKIAALNRTNNPSLSQQVTSLHGGATYRFAVWARVAAGSPAVDAAVKIETYNAAGTNTNGRYGRLVIPADGQWKQISLTYMVDADTVSAKLYLRIFGLGTALFDDATFALMREAPEIFIIGPHRTLINDGESKQLTYQLQFREPWQGVGLLVAQIRDLTSTSTQEIAAKVTLSANKRQGTATMSLPALTAGDYALDFTSQRAGRKIRTTEPAYIFTFVRARRPRSMAEDGTILRDGKPFFPIGIYHPGTPETYDMLAQNGFNTIQGSASTNLDSLQDLLDAAHKSGLVVDVPLYINLQVAKNLDNSLAIVKRFAAHPAVLNWKIIDEPDLRPEIAHEVPLVYRALKSADRHHPLELTLSGDGDLPFWSQFSDIVQIDRYPLPGNPLIQVSDSSAKAKAAMEPWQHLGVALQCGWNPDLTNQPTPAQARSMVYLALIGGAKGIWWYSMYDPGWDLTKTPLWPHMKAINGEIASLSPPVLQGKVVEHIRCDNPKVHFKAFEYQTKTYLLMTNPENEPLQASFTLPENLRKWHDMDGSSNGSITAGKLIISLQGIDSKTLVVER